MTDSIAQALFTLFATVAFSLVGIGIQEVGLGKWLSRTFQQIRRPFAALGRGIVSVAHGRRKTHTNLDAMVAAMVTPPEPNRLTDGYITGGYGIGGYVTNGQIGPPPATPSAWIRPKPAEPDGTLFMECGCGHVASYHSTSPGPPECLYRPGGKTSPQCSCRSYRSDVIAHGRHTEKSRPTEKPRSPLNLPRATPQDVPPGKHPDDRRVNVIEIARSYGTSWECGAGQTDPPSGCERHHEHHWCAPCAGWYGVPHDDIHKGPGRHPLTGIAAAQCACRLCQTVTANR